MVDLDGLERLAGALERIDSQLARAKADLHAGTDVLGAQLQDEMNRVFRDVPRPPGASGVGVPHATGGSR